LTWVEIPMSFGNLDCLFTYAYYKKLDYFSTECTYSPNAYRGYAREFIKDLESIRPRAILDIIKSGESFRFALTTKMPEQGTCEKCGYISSQKWCKACVLLDGLNRGLPRLGIGRTRGKSSSATGIQTDNSSDKQTSIRNDKRILKPSLDF
jgi:cytoplasmic tRNA 2-thiolation protein 1